jgi:hypothetical protein
MSQDLNERLRKIENDIQEIKWIRLLSAGIGIFLIILVGVTEYL